MSELGIVVMLFVAACCSFTGGWIIGRAMNIQAKLNDLVDNDGLFTVRRTTTITSLPLDGSRSWDSRSPSSVGPLKGRNRANPHDVN
jgi:hypothetical protein